MRRGLYATLLLSACNTGVDADSSDPLDVNAGETRGSASDNDEHLWPKPGDRGERRGRLLMEDFSDVEPSGIVVDRDASLTYVVSDDGRLFRLVDDGNVEGHWAIGGDPEGLALDPSTDTLFVADEEGSQVKLWDLSNDAFVPDAFCTLDVPASGKKGLEAITFVPEGDAPQSWGYDSSGFIVAGTQARAALYVYPLDSCEGGEDISALDLGAAALESTKDDVSGLAYDAEAKVLLVLHDGKHRDTIDRMTLEGDVVKTYELPGDGNSEGVALGEVDCENGEAAVDIADDNGQVKRWTGFSIDCDGAAQ